MITGFKEYLKAVGITEPIENRIVKIYEHYKILCPEAIVGGFISEYITSEGLRQYQSLWFFSENYIMEAKVFITKDILDLTLYKNSIKYLQLNVEEFDLVKATDKSRASLMFILSSASCSFKASKENCDYLMVLIKKFIMPNVVKTA